jgi:hypothetical protein
MSGGGEGHLSGLISKRKSKMAFGYTVCLSLIWLLRLVAGYTKYFSAVFVYLPLVVNDRGFIAVCMGPKEW